MTTTGTLLKLATLAVAGLLMLTGPVANASENSKSSRVPKPVMNHPTDAEQCVEPTEVMKRRHMEFILDQRDKTMHQGIRTKQYSLKTCVNCHADPKTNSVLGKEGFCESCHVYAAVTIDCFGCHTDAPEKKDAAAGHRVFGILGLLTDITRKK